MYIRIITVWYGNDRQISRLLHDSIRDASKAMLARQCPGNTGPVVGHDEQL